jgi:hypothetical protein
MEMQIIAGFYRFLAICTEGALAMAEAQLELRKCK